MSAPIVLAELTSRSAYFAGDMGVIHAAVRLTRCSKQYDAKRRALAVPRFAADDVMAAIESQFGGDVQIVEAIT